jgi:protein-S-isoprenylcysteine O-methyltransferase Ste14
VNKGIYSYVRHPIHSGTFLEFTGIFLLFPRVTVGIACLIGLGWVLVQTWAEEQDLLKRIPDYHEYMKQAPRFFPRVFTRGKNKMDT